MKTTFAVTLMGLIPAVLAQSAAPSPTESVGCEPHGDHWHCEAARTDAVEDKAEASVTLAPSPTESVGCEPHGDHWHCEAARTTLATKSGSEAATTEEHDHDHDHETETSDDHDHNHETDTDHEADATESLAPSPTASVGCEPHGDHWHCEGPATAAVTEASGTPTSSESVEITNAAGMEMVPVVGLFAIAVLAL